MLALTVSSLAACSRVRYVPLAGVEREELEADAPVDIMVTRLPGCPYREVGLLQTHARSFEKALEPLRKKARAVGANAVWVKNTGPGSIEGIALVVGRCGGPRQSALAQ